MTTKIEDLIKDIARVKNIEEVILSTDEVKIYKVMSNRSDSWTLDYPYRIIINKSGVWKNVNEVVATFDDAFLLYLREKHLGSNSDFVHFVKKMLAK